MDAGRAPDDVHVVARVLARAAAVLGRSPSSSSAGSTASAAAGAVGAGGVGRARIRPDALPDRLPVPQARRPLPDDRLRLVLPRLHAARVPAADPDRRPGRGLRGVVRRRGGERRGRGVGVAVRAECAAGCAGREAESAPACPVSRAAATRGVGRFSVAVRASVAYGLFASSTAEFVAGPRVAAHSREHSARREDGRRRVALPKRTAVFTRCVRVSRSRT